MKMKKTFMALALAAVVGTIGLQQASAHGFDGNGRGDFPHRQFHRLDEATKVKIEKFQAESQDLRKQIVMKQAEELALTRSENPDMNAVRKAAGELFDLRTAMQEKAKAAGLFAPVKDKETKAKISDKLKKIEGFLAETKDLRKQVFVKRAEERTLMHSKTPNAEEVAKISGELFDLRTSLRDKAKAAGLERDFHRFDGRKMGHERRSFHDRGFGLMGDNGTGNPGPERGSDLLFAGE
jgi:zinc resistance-associated protein